MNTAFQAEIKDWDSWGKVFQSIPAFEKLITKIFEKENLAVREISHLTAGSNAVFKVDNLVIKIFAPVESGVNTEIDYNCEILGMKRAITLGINIPKVIATAYIEDKYLFRYIIMDYINGKEAKNVLKNYSVDEKIKFVGQLKENIYKMNTVINEEYPTLDVREKALANTRWNILPRDTVTQIKELVKNYNISNKVYVHGDITGDNTIITEDGKLYIIDFADGTIAPKEYELPSILFDLFDFDKLMIKEFIGTDNVEDFTEKCFYGTLIHEFGICLVELVCEKIMGIEIEKMTDILKVKEALGGFFQECLTNKT